MGNGYRIQIDELRLCFHANREQLNELETVEIGDSIDFYGLVLRRIASDSFRYYFAILDNYNEHIGYIKYWHFNDGEEAYLNVFVKVKNDILYREETLSHFIFWLTDIGLIFNNYTSIDLAIDSNINFPSIIKKLMRDKDILTIVNGKRVDNRKDILEGICFEYSTSLDRLWHPTITFKQKKAMKSKNEGIIVQAYDKKAEIENTSDKQYILDYYGNPKKLYRLEVRLHYQELRDYFIKQNIVVNENIIFNQELLEKMFFYHLSAVIRFTKKRRKIDWIELIKCNGRV